MKKWLPIALLALSFACSGSDGGTGSDDGFDSGTNDTGVDISDAGADMPLDVGGADVDAGREECTPGEFVDGSGCTACATGTFSGAVDSATCTACPAGSFAGMEGATVCEACPVDTFSSQPGASSCTACPTGETTSGETGAVACGTCPEGTEFDEATATCVDCPAGSFNDVMEKFQDMEGASMCKDCPANTFSGPGSTACDPCPMNQCSPPGSSSCTAC